MSGLLTQARRQEHAQRVVENKSRLVKLLRGDFEEIENRFDINLLKNFIRQAYHIDVRDPVTDSMLYGGYLSLKRKLVSPLETVGIRPRTVEIHGTFANSYRVQPVIVSRYNGVFCDRCGHYTVSEYKCLPLMSVFVNESPYKVTIMTEYGDFCDITEKEAIISNY